PVIVDTLEQNHFKLTPEQLEQTITDRTKAVIINSPNNPTGMIYDKHELKQIGDICLKYDVMIISDEIYEKLIYSGYKHTSINQISNRLKLQFIIINVLSNSYAMTECSLVFA